MLGKLFSNVPPENFHLRSAAQAGGTGEREKGEEEKRGKGAAEGRKEKGRGSCC